MPLALKLALDRMAHAGGRKTVDQILAGDTLDKQVGRAMRPVRYWWVEGEP